MTGRSLWCLPNLQDRFVQLMLPGPTEPRGARGTARAASAGSACRQAKAGGGARQTGRGVAQVDPLFW